MRKRISIKKIIGLAVLGVIVAIVLTTLLPKFFIGSNPDITKAFDKAAFTEEDIAKELKDTPSDIENMSIYDKFKKGLNMEMNSDTDEDGLTDKEEIEIYGSDPLKMSTSGDLYSDKYKVENGMDINTYYEREKETIVFSGNTCPEIELTAKDYVDTLAFIEDVSDIYTLKSHKNYMTYRITNYNGGFAYDTKLLKSMYGLEDEDVTIYYSDGPNANAKQASYKIEDGKFIVNDKLDQDKTYYYYVVDKKTLNTPDKVDFVAYSVTETPMAFCEISILNLGGVIKPTIYYKQLRNQAQTNQVIESMINAVDYSIGNKIKYKYGTSTEGEKKFFGSEQSPWYTDEKIVPLPERELLNKINARRKVFGSQEWKYEKQENWTYGIYHFFSYDQMLQTGTQYIAPLRNNANLNGEVIEEKNTGFNDNVDRFSFVNYKNSFTEGHCAGFAGITMEIFNNGSVNEPSGSYSSDLTNNKEISWDLTKDAENATFMDKGIYDYKEAGFEKKLASNNLTGSEKEVANFMDAMWAKYCDLMRSKVQTMYIGGTKENSKNNKFIESIIEKLNEGKILYMDFCQNEFAHAINIVGYTKYKVNGALERKKQERTIEYDTYDGNHSTLLENTNELLIFDVYDNNYTYNKNNPGAFNGGLEITKKLKRSTIDRFNSGSYTLTGYDYDYYITYVPLGLNAIAQLNDNFGHYIRLTNGVDFL